MSKDIKWEDHILDAIRKGIKVEFIGRVLPLGLLIRTKRCCINFSSKYAFICFTLFAPLLFKPTVLGKFPDKRAPICMSWPRL